MNLKFNTRYIKIRNHIHNICYGFYYTNLVNNKKTYYEPWNNIMINGLEQ